MADIKVIEVCQVVEGSERNCPQVVPRKVEALKLAVLEPREEFLDIADVHVAEN